MGFYLNSKKPYLLFQEERFSTYYIDKSSILKELVSLLGSGEVSSYDSAVFGKKSQKYICITRPRRFGKTVAANMIASYFEKNIDSHELFDGLYASGCRWFEEHLNQHHVIHIMFNEMPDECTTYAQYISRIKRRLLEDLSREFPELHLDREDALWDALNSIIEFGSGEKFIFVLDEWDFIFHRNFITDADKAAYIDFLSNLLKDQPYVELAYMTGILPIAKYSSGSELNMFSEYTMASEERFSAQFGFTDAEVDLLFERYQNLDFPEEHVTRDGLRIWYDGYKTKRGGQVYNPRSVVLSLTNNNLGNYWTSSGPYDELFYYIKGNADAVRDDLALMVSGVSVPSKVREYAATSMNLQTKDEIFSAMVVYGFLNFENGFVSIPNRELMEKFAYMLQKEPSLGYVHRLARESEKMLQATLAMDTRTMCRILEYAHNSETPLLHYNNEAELTAIVNLCYLSARDHYRMEREDKAGTGYVDFIFYPEYDLSADGIILELKVDHTAQEALRQIKEKQYVLRFAPRMGEVQKFTGRILAVGIAYDRQTKHHVCEMEVLKEAASPYRIFHGQSVPYECTGKD